MSDVIQTTSDLFSAVANHWETIYYDNSLLFWYYFEYLRVTDFAVLAVFPEMQRIFGEYS